MKVDDTRYSYTIFCKEDGGSQYTCNIAITKDTKKLNEVKNRESNFFLVLLVN